MCEGTSLATYEAVLVHNDGGLEGIIIGRCTGIGIGTGERMPFDAVDAADAAAVVEAGRGPAPGLELRLEESSELEVESESVSLPACCCPTKEVASGTDSKLDSLELFSSTGTEES